MISRSNNNIPKAKTSVENNLGEYELRRGLSYPLAPQYSKRDLVALQLLFSQSALNSPQSIPRDTLFGCDLMFPAPR